MRGALVWLLAALLAQGTVMHYAVVRGAEPSLVLVAVVWFAMRSTWGRAALFGLIAGLGEDILAFDSSGTWMVATTATALLASLPTRRFFEDSIPLFALVTAGATLARDLIYWNVKSLEGYPAGLATVHFHKSLEAAVLNAVLAIVVMAVARRFERRGSLARLRG
jgi:rod shape-determining protein MreD